MHAKVLKAEINDSLLDQMESYCRFVLMDAQEAAECFLQELEKSSCVIVCETSLLSFLESYKHNTYHFIVQLKRIDFNQMSWKWLINYNQLSCSQPKNEE